MMKHLTNVLILLASVFITFMAVLIEPTSQNNTFTGSHSLLNLIGTALSLVITISLLIWGITYTKRKHLNKIWYILYGIGFLYVGLEIVAIVITVFTDSLKGLVI